jgi:peptidoglycan/xylan/chitin deacetylase (PgdA/CDA1 family)
LFFGLQFENSMDRKLVYGTLLCLLPLFFGYKKRDNPDVWIRINLMGYQPTSLKIAVWCASTNTVIKTFQLIDARTKKIAFSGSAGKAYGAYGPFTQTYRLDFSAFKKPGSFYLQAGGARSPEFRIGLDVYRGTADFCLRYMRQQRSGFNPFLKDSCHTRDGYTLYGPMPDSTHLDVSGGWHDASDYLQYSSTSANATYHLLMAYRDFPGIFGDQHQYNGLEGGNGKPDVLDEAKWGLDWLLKMHPREDWMFNQLADDRDHQGMRIPKEDSFYGKGIERPIYFINGEPQQRGSFKNQTTGTSSTAAKFSSAFGLGAEVFGGDESYAELLKRKAASAFAYSNKKPGVTQTVSVRSPYIYAEDNWVDDMELAAVHMGRTREMDAVQKKPGVRNEEGNTYYQKAMGYARDEPITPWLGADTARHYQWYPFINLGHYALARQMTGSARDTLVGYYREGISRVWAKAKSNAFYRGVPFIWCSNNLTVSFVIECYWYRQLSGDRQFEALEQAGFDWLFGCNPWGSSMVYGLPANGDTPVDPHSAFTHLKNYPIDGGLVDGPVYGNIFKNLRGITLYEPDEYAAFQSSLAVYHDDYGDYSTNEPTMDGTASLIYLLAAKESPQGLQLSHGGIIRGDSTKKKIAIVFTGHEFADGAGHIRKTLKENQVKASFFFTGAFYRNPRFKNFITGLKADGHYLGAHSNEHLLYCDWTKRDSLLVTKNEFHRDLQENYAAMKSFGIDTAKAKFFLPPYEWYNDSIASWTAARGLQLINYTPGTLSHADYTTPEDKNYRDSKTIFNSIQTYEQIHVAGMNGFILLLHVGTDPKRKDKFYSSLQQLIQLFRIRGYQLVGVDDLLR